MTGSTATALGPTSRSSVGTSRQPSTFLRDELLEKALDGDTRIRVPRQEHEPDTVLTLGRECERRDLPEKPIRHLQQDAGAVAGVGLAAAGAAMPEVHQHLQCLAHDCVRAPALDVHDEADAAGVVLVQRIVEAGRGGGACDRSHAGDLSQTWTQKGNTMITSTA
jgi:hypothetical protein